MVSYPRRLQSGQITCYLNRTYHVLTTLASPGFDKEPIHLYSALHERNLLLQQVRRAECRQRSVLQPLWSAHEPDARCRPASGFVIN